MDQGTNIRFYLKKIRDVRLEPYSTISDGGEETLAMCAHRYIIIRVSKKNDRSH